MEGRRRKNKFSSGLISFQHEREKTDKNGNEFREKEERLVQFCEATCASLCVFVE
jgi:hypothetical protein